MNVAQLTRETLATEHSGSEPSIARRRYLAVFESGSSFVVSLPLAGEVVVGRGDEAGLRLSDPKVSRRHVRLALAEALVTVSDLGSQNQTFVNGEPLQGSRNVASGDVIEIGNSALVFHDSSARLAEPGLVGPGELRAALAAELNRAALAARPLALAAFALTASVEPTRVEAARAALANELVGVERIAVDGPSRLVVVMPDLPRDEAARRVASLLDTLRAEGLDPQAGLAVHPIDGCDADTLLSGAREAAERSRPSELAHAELAHRTLELGDCQVLLADPAMLALYRLIERLAPSDLPVLVVGETGTGKELAAQALHHFSARKRAHLVAVNCAALPESLVESELFGHEKGAFTGAVAAKPGLLEAGHGGTVFLDEIGELPLGTQAKLLRALDTKRIVRVGDVTERPIDVRIVAATHRELEREIAGGRFRQDLYFRLSGATLCVPPLRDRPRELALLATRFLSAARARLGQAPARLSDDALRLLAAHAWPGNVRELKNVMEYAAAAFDAAVIEPWQLQDRLRPDPTHAAPAPASPTPALAVDAPPPSTTLAAAVAFRPLEEEIEELEQRRIREALAVAGGNQTRAAELIGVPLRTFVSKLTRYGLRGKRG